MASKRTKKSRHPIDHFTDKAAARIVRVVRRLQNGFAGFMNKATKGYSASTWKTLIVLLCVSWGGLSGYFIIAAIKNDAPVKLNSSRLLELNPTHPDSLQAIEQLYKQEKNKTNK